ncbi:hypothetical protein [Clostridium botulinum]|nr:hypothetical protein [Clostridium botulinum]CBZ04057.1 hypothetical protein H04402_02249 [Clostridium botulinum H04402 065]
MPVGGIIVNLEPKDAIIRIFNTIRLSDFVLALARLILMSAAIA